MDLFTLIKDIRTRERELLEPFYKIRTSQETMTFLRSSVYDYGFNNYIEQGGSFNQMPPMKNWTEALLVDAELGPLGLKCYLEKGGKLSPDFRDENGQSEFMSLLTNTSFREIDIVIDIYIQNGGVFTPEQLSNDGSNEVMFISRYSGTNAAKNLKKYFDSGGMLNPHVRDFRGYNELQYLIDYGGQTSLDALRLFIEQKGVFDPSHRNNHGSSEVAIISRLGIEGLQLYVEHGGMFSNDFKDGDFTDVMAIAMNVGVEGLKLFLDNGGRFSPHIKNSKGYSEEDLISKFCGQEGLSLFYKQIWSDPKFYLKNIKSKPKSPRL
jgi:hypothetical protein